MPRMSRQVKNRSHSEWPPEKWYRSPSLMPQQIKVVKSLVQGYRDFQVLIELLGFSDPKQLSQTTLDSRIVFQASTKNSQPINECIKKLISRLTKAQRQFLKIQTVPVPKVVLNPQPGLLMEPYDPEFLKAYDRAIRKTGPKKTIYRRQAEQMP